MVHMRLNRHTFLSPFQHIWQYLLAEPCTGLFLCFFQPNRCGTEYEQQGVLKRIVLMLRLALPLFLLTYPFAVALQVLLSDCLFSCHTTASSSVSIGILLFIVQATALGIGCSMVAGLLGDTGLGVVLGVALGM